MGELNLRFFGRRRLRPVIQAEAAECGLACITMIANYYGHHIDLGTLRRQWSPSTKGMTLKDVLAVGEYLHLISRAVRLELEEIELFPTPAILHWGMDHFVVLERITKKGYELLDPAIGRITVSQEVFSKKFTGIAVSFTPATDFKPKKREPTLRLRDFMKGQAGAYQLLSQIFFVSMALQVLAMILPFFGQSVVDDVVVSNNRDLLFVLAIGFALLVIINSVINVFRDWVVVYLAARLKFSWGTGIFHHLIRLPLEYFEKRQVADIQSRFGSLNELQELVATKAVTAVVDGIMAITTLVVMFLYGPLLGGIVLLFVMIYAGLRAMLYSKLRARSYEQILAMARQENLLLESVRGAQAVKTFGREPQRDSLWQSLISATINAEIETNRYSVIQENAKRFLLGMLNVLVIYLAASMILAGQFSVGMLVAFLSYKQQFTERASSVIDKFMEFKLIGIHLDRLADIINTEAENTIGNDLEVVNTPLRGEIELRNVYFRYSQNEPYVLEDISLHIQAGEHVVITAPTGFGKTTLLKIMMGLLRPESGEVLIDGKSIDQYGLARFRKQTAAVMQDDQLLNGTLLENITFFDPEVDEERLSLSINDAAIGEDISRMPMNLYTLVGDMGTSFSGGQKQRIILSRALYHAPRILFMDEATSHLDEATECRVIEALRKKNITIVSIAHRRETIESASRIIDLGANNGIEGPEETEKMAKTG